MDKDHLFQNQYSWGCGYTYDQYTEKCANRITQTGVSDSYFLGYVSPEDLPSTTFPTKVYFDDDNDIITFESASKNNAMIGYCRYTGYDYSGFAFKQSNGVNVYNYNLNEYWYLNNFYPEFSSTCENLRLQFWYILYDGGAAYQTFSQTNFNISGYSSINAFLKGYLNVGLTIYNKNYIVNYDDLVAGNGTLYLEASDGSGWGARIFLAQIWFAGGSKYNGSYQSGGGYPCHIKTFGDFDDGTSGYLYRFGQCFGVSELSRYCAFATGRNGQTPRRLYKNETYERGAGLFETVQIHEDELPYDRDTFAYSDGVITRCTVTDGFYEFYLYITNPSSIKTVLDLAYRVNPGRVASYAEGLSYATDVRGDNFLVNLKTGDINNPAFKSGLMPWQYVDVDSEIPVDEQGAISNEFTVDDLPPYEPTPPPEPEEEGNNPDNPDAALGQVDDTPADQIEEDRMNDDRTVYGANSFITQYVLTLGQLTALGQYLWSSITDPNSNGLKNFIAIFSDTGTFNSANCLQCFVSLKVFPFDMFNTVYSTTAPDLRAGSGATALLSESVTVFSSCTYSIDCGSVVVTADGYNIVAGQYDFRNYINTTVCVFLPFCGTVELNPADVFGYTLSCMYYIDVSSGTCTACVFVDRDDNKRLMVASKSGQIGFNIPMSATNAMQVAGTFLSDAASAAQTISDTVLSLATSKALGSIGAPVEDAAASQQYLQGNVRATSSAVGKATSGIAGAISGLGNMMSRSGCAYPSLSGGTGMAALFFDKTPYVVIRRSNYSSPNNYAHTTGFSTTDGGTEHKSTLGSYSGWTVVKNCDLKNIHANREELDEIIHLLETGVFL